MGGGGSSNTTSKTTQTTELPAYAKPFYMQGMASAQGMLNQPYTPYGGQRIADFTQQQQNLQGEVAGMQTPGQFGTATDLTTAAGIGSLNASQYAPNQFNAQMVGQPNLQNYGMTAPDQFGTQQAQQYMSPYAQNVMDVQKREAIRDAQKGQLVQDLGAARQGTYGGSRQLLAGMERERNLGQQLGDIQYKGQQAAYENAQAQFERDRAAGMTAGQQNLNALLQTQQLGTQTGLQALLANQQYGLEAQKLGEQSRQFASQQELAGYGQAGQMGQTLTNIGQAEQNADIARLGLQGQTAAQQQALSQQYLDTAYQDFQRQSEAPYTNLSRYMSLLQGVPITPNTSSSTTAPSPSVASQLLGTGLGAASLYNMYKGG